MTSLAYFDAKPAVQLAQLQTRICGESKNTTELSRDGLVVRSQHFASVARGLAAVIRARVRT